MTQNLGERIRRSAEWAAFGDAVGFITELADSDRVQHRLGVERVVDTVGWRRKVGGYNGVSVDFQPGTYSDDTQLRLATGRGIRGDGTFDVAAFAKVELPAWANYALGAGAGSKEAATHLARTSATWYSNFFDGSRASYMRAGGNGAAMRIQPHVWAARDHEDHRTLLIDVVRNSICTHGHPRGILGACLHALTLAFALRERRPAGIKELSDLTIVLESVPKVVEADGDLSLFWLGPWEEASGSSFKECTIQAIAEISEDIEKLCGLEKRGELAQTYDQALKVIGARDPAVRGLGTKTALLAAFAASLTDPAEPLGGLLPIANALGSDTDSIATMAGAIVGVCSDAECEGTIQDLGYIRTEAQRLAAIASSQEATSFRYPDLRTWRPPRAAVDAVGLVGDRLWLNGLGELTPLDDQRVESGDDTLIWCRLSFGQTILARIRSKPRTLIPEHTKASDADGTRQRDARPPTRLRNMLGFEDASVQKGYGNGRSENDSLNEVLQRVISGGFSPDLIGKAILKQADGRGDFVERGIALTATILTAYEARMKRSRK